jgi:hypothetical protein
MSGSSAAYPAWPVFASPTCGKSSLAKLFSHEEIE